MVEEMFTRRDSSISTIEEFATVEERPLYTYDYRHSSKYSGNPWGAIQAPKHKAIVNTDTNEVISVVGIGYKPIQNSVAVRKYEDALFASRLDCRAMQRKVSSSHNGARTVVTYTFPAHEMEVAEGDPMYLRTTLLNSYDGTWRLGSLLGALRLACTNGQVVHDSFTSFFGKHTKSLEVDDVVKKLELSLDVYMENVELWKQYPSTKVSVLDAEKVLLALAKGSKKTMKILTETHAKYVLEMGNNLWALFNTLTDWSSHTKVRKESNKSSIIINREQKVRQVLPLLENLRLAA